ncbi:MAG: ATP-binding protein [Motiliproteus sp.]
MNIFKAGYESSLRGQLLTFLLTSIALLAITSSVVGSWIGSAQSHTMVLNSSLQIAGNLAELSVLSLITDSEDNAAEAVTQVLGFNDVVGVAIFTSQLAPLLQKGEVKWRATELRQWQRSLEPELVKDSANNWYIAAPVWLQGEFAEEDEFALGTEPPEQLGFVLINISKASLNKLSDNLLVYNLVIALAIAVLMGLLMNIGLRRVIRPLFTLSSIMREAQLSGEHNYAVVEGPKEIRQMADSYNEMMKVLEKQEDVLINMNASLESEVEIQTHELIQARDAALTAVRTKSEFLANISHELRTPLQAVIGYIELVREELEYEAMDAQVEDLDAAMKASQRLLALIGAILDLAKSEAGKMELSPQDVSVYEMVDEAVGVIRPLVAENDNCLEIVKPAQDVRFRVDKDKVMQILLNLLSNACKFTEQGTIRLDVGCDDIQLNIRVVDTGVGIAEDQQGVIFDEFRQVDGSVRRKYGGTGLGLAISRHFTEMLGGSIRIDSRLGEGTCFELILPLENAQNSSVKNT